MATGARDEYWARPNLPTIFKHDLLQRYLPPFAGMTGSQTSERRLVYLDGYAGRGRYDDGKPGSAERVLKIAMDQKARVNLAWKCYFVEADPSSSTALTTVVQEYVAAGVEAVGHHGGVLDVLDEVIADACGCPFFAFLDPCGLGVPMDRLTAILTGERRATKPPTEVLLNFSLEAVRRIGGHVSSPHANATTLAHMDATLGGDWWQKHFSAGVDDEGVDAVVAGFAGRLRAATGMSVVSVPVRRAPTHKPIYHLVFGTRSPYGLWVFGDSVARATQRWWDSLEEIEQEAEPFALFPASATMRPDIASTEQDATPALVENLRRLLAQHPGGYRVIDHVTSVFGDFYGQVRETAIRTAVKELHKQKGTSTTGVGPKPRELRVDPPRP